MVTEKSLHLLSKLFAICTCEEREAAVCKHWEEMWRLLDSTLSPKIFYGDYKNLGDNYDGDDDRNPVWAEFKTLLPRIFFEGFDECDNNMICPTPWPEAKKNHLQRNKFSWPPASRGGGTLFLTIFLMIFMIVTTIMNVTTMMAMMIATPCESSPKPTLSINWLALPGSPSP